MNTLYPAERKNDSLDIGRPLADSMDQSIGEATTVMGAMITELMRRSLRGGIVRVGDELSAYVSDQVETTLTERVPELEKAAVAVAEQTAQIAAAKVAAEEVYASEARTGEVTRRLGTQIEEVDKRATETTRLTAEDLGGRIAEAERRVSETTQAEFTQRLNEVLEKAREGSAILKGRIKALEDLTAGLGEQLREEQAARKGEIQANFAKLHQGLEGLGQKLSHGIELCQARLKDEVRELRKANEELAARVSALEHPPGFFSKLFGKKKGKGEAGA